MIPLTLATLIIAGAACFTVGVLVPTPPFIIRLYEWVGLKKR